MNKFKKFLALLLALSMMLGAVPFSVFASESNDPTDETVAEVFAEADAETVLADYGIAAAALTMGTKPEDGTTPKEPFPQDTGNSNSFRIPALVTLSDGTLVAAADARWNTTYDGGGLDTVVSRSTDGGDNWSFTFANYLGDNGNVYNGSGSTAFIDPAIAVTNDDTIYMLVDLYPYGIALNGSGNTAPATTLGFSDDNKLKLSDNSHSSYDYYLDLTDYKIYPNDSATAVSDYTVDKYYNITGTDGTNTNLFFSDSPFKVVRTGFLYLTTSTNGGASWSEPKLLNLKTDQEQVCLVGPGRGLVTSEGTIIFPVYKYNGSEASQQTGFIYSTDGTTWTRSANFTGATWSSESAVVELDSGNLRFFYRNGTKNLCYVDYDLTAGTWGSPVSTGIATNSNCQISAITYSKTIDGKQVILVSCPTGPSEAGSDKSGAEYRLNGKIFVFTVSDDGEMAKKGAISVTSNEAQFMYSCMTELSDGTVGILYEDKQSAWGTGDNYYYTMSYTEYDLATELSLTFDEKIGPHIADSETNKKVSAVTVPLALSGKTLSIKGMANGQSASAVSDNEAVVAASVSGSTLTLTPVAAGTAKVTVTIAGAVAAADTDGTDTTTTIELAVTVVQEVVDVSLRVGQTETLEDLTGDWTGDGEYTDPDGAIAGMELVSGRTTGVKKLKEVTDGSSFDANKQYVVWNANTYSYLEGKNIAATGGYGDKSALAVNSEATFSQAVTAQLWTIKAGGNGGYYLMQGDNYLAIAGFYAKMLTTQTALTLEYSESGWTLFDGNTYKNRDDHETDDSGGAYLHDGVTDGNYSNVAIGVGKNSTGGNRYWKIYEVVEDYTAIAFTGAGPGTTTAQVGGTVYNITVKQYEEKDVLLLVGDSQTYTDKTGNYENAAANMEPDGTYATMSVIGVDSTSETTVSTQKATSLKNGATYILRVFDTEYALSSNSGRGDWYTSTLAFEYNALTANEKHMWILEAVDGGYKLKSAAGYLNLGTDNNAAYVNATGETFTITYTDTGWTIGNQSGKYINALGGLNSYTAGGWTGNDTRFDLYEVTTVAEARTDIEFNGIAPGTTTAIVGNTQYNITVYKMVDITINYQFNEQTVAKEVVPVPSYKTSMTLPKAVADANNGYYAVSNTELPLTSEVTYNVPVTKMDGDYIEVKERGSNTLNLLPLDEDLEGGQYVEWTTADGEYVSVAANYNKDGTVTNSATIIGNKVTDDPDVDDDPIVIPVTGTVYNSDGTVVSTKNWLVKVTKGNGDVSTGKNTEKYIYIDIVRIQNTTVYYAINGGALVEITDDMLEDVTEDGVTYQKLKVPLMDEQYAGGFQITFFAKPDEGYALTYMSSSNSDEEYYTLSNGNADGVGSGAWPFVEGYDYDKFDALTPKPDGKDETVFDTAVGVRWGLRESNFTVAQLKVMYTNAIAEGCDGALVFTKNGPDGLNTDLEFISDKLPEVSKELNGVLGTDGKEASFRRYVGTEMNAAVGEHVYFTIEIKQTAPVEWEPKKDTNGTVLKDEDGNPIIATDEYGKLAALKYIEDKTKGIYSKLIDNLDGAYFYTKEWDLEDGKYDGYLTSGREFKQDITALLNRGWSDDEIAAGYRVHDFYVVVEITNNYLDETIVNNVDLEYAYSSSYSRGQKSATSTAEANIHVVGQYMSPFVIDFGLPISVLDEKKELGFQNVDLAKTTCKYGEVNTEKVTGSDLIAQADGVYKLTYTPNQILQGPDPVILLNIDGKSVNAFTVYPATTVYYEESFIDIPEEWKNEWMVSDTSFADEQELDHLGDVDGNRTAIKNYNYGYDPVYEGTGASENSHITTATIGAEAKFVFTGTGFEVYANCTEGTGSVLVEVRDTNNAVVKMYIVNTVVGAGETDVTAGQTGEFYNLPIVSLQGMDHGQYTVTLRKIKDDGAVNIDGIRIFGTIDDNPNTSIYATDGENSPSYVELRDQVLTGIDVAQVEADSEYSFGNMLDDKNGYYDVALNDVGKKIIDQVYDVAGTTEGAILLNYGNGWDDARIKDLLDNGPKNELYLWPGQAVVFALEDHVTAQVGMHAVQGATSYSFISGNQITDGDTSEEAEDSDGNTITIYTCEGTIKSSTDMFYHTVSGNVAIVNTGEQVLSITLLKLFGSDGTPFDVPESLDVAVAAFQLAKEHQQNSGESGDGETGETTQTVGDANGDGEITNVDAMTILQIFVSGSGYDAVYDVNGDGKVDNVDAMLVLQYFVGLITEFPTVN